MNSIKEKVLSEIMDLMDEEDGKKLGKHPKVMAAKLTIAKPLDKGEEDKEVESPEEDASEMQMDDETMGALSGINGIEDLENLSPDKKEKLLQMLMK